MILWLNDPEPPDCIKCDACGSMNTINEDSDDQHCWNCNEQLFDAWEVQ